MSISESIWNNGRYIIPMAEVSHLEIEASKNTRGVWVVFKHSKHNPHSELRMKMEPAIWLDGPDEHSFKKEWCFYRSQAEGLLETHIERRLP